MKSRSNRESFEIVRISAGSVTTIVSTIPGKISAASCCDHSAPMRRDRFKTRLPCTAFVIDFLRHFRSLL